MTTITITPTGKDDTSAIQNVAISGNEVIANGNFKVTGTLKFPSNFKFALNGTMQGTNQDMITNSGSSTSNITMIGGIYRGNGGTTNRLIEFVNTTNSNFSNMIIENTGHCFGLTTGSSGNTCTNLIARNSLNGLADRGDNNTWNDCISENNSSDNWIIKCRKSTFNRCIGRNSTEAVGFGLYARTDQSNDIGAIITNNKFNRCQAYGNAHSGFSLNCPSNGHNAKIENNFIQAIIYDNCKKQDVTTQAGIYLRNKLSGSTLRNNQFDIITYDNQSKGGLAFEASYPITGNTGNIIAYRNKSYDIDMEKATGNNFNIYHPTNKQMPKISKGSNTINIIDFTCPGLWCINKYCDMTFC